MGAIQSSSCYNLSFVGEVLCGGTLGNGSSCNRKRRGTRWVSLSLHLLARKHSVSPLQVFCSIFPRMSTQVCSMVSSCWLTDIYSHFRAAATPYPFSSRHSRGIQFSESDQIQLIWSVSLQHTGLYLNSSLYSFLPSTGHFFGCSFLSLKSAHPSCLLLS